MLKKIEQMFSLEGQVAIITGGAQGIGEGICKVGHMTLRMQGPETYVYCSWGRDPAGRIPL